MVKHLSHSMKMSEKYYEFMSSKDATEEHSSIHSLSLSRKWSQEDINKIKDCWPLSGIPPPIRECIEFIKQSGIVRNARDVHYKW